MKKFHVFLALATLLSGGNLRAQAGDVAVQTVEAAKSNHWQNWAFAGSMLLTAAGAIFVVSVHNGHEVQSASH